MTKRILFAICVSLLIISLSIFTSAAEITSADDLLTLMNTSSMWADDYTLTKDINLADATNGLAQTPIGNPDNPFTGTFDGQGYEISGIELSGVDYVALFGSAANATIKNLTVSGTVIGTGTRAAGIVAQVEDAGFIIENCVNRCDVTGVGHVGGVIGRLVPDGYDAIIRGCKNEGTITGSSTYTGGVLATSSQNGGSTIIEQCMNSGSVNGVQYVGGIVGYFRVYSASANKCFVQDCINMGNVNATSKVVGGIIGAGNGAKYAYTVTRCFNSGSITSDNTSATYVRPIIAAVSSNTKSAGQVTYCYYSSNDTYISGDSSYADAETYVADATVASNFAGLGTNWIVVDGHAPELAVFHKHDASGEYTPSGNKHIILCYCGDVVLSEEHTFTDSVCTKCGATESACAHANTTVITETPATCVSTGAGYEFCSDCNSNVGDVVLPKDASNHAEQALTMSYANGAVSYTCGGCSAVAYTDSTLSDRVYVSQNGLELIGNITTIGTESAPFKNFTDAMQYAAYCGKDVTVTILDTAEIPADYITPSFENTITVKGGTLVTNNRFILGGSMVFENICFSNAASLVIAAHENKLVMGEGITMSGADVYLVGGYENRLDSNSDIPASGITTDIMIRSGVYHDVGGGNRYLSGAYSGTIKITIGKTNPNDTLEFTSTLVTGSLNYEGGDGVFATVIFDGPVDNIATFRPITHPSSEVAGRFDVDVVVQGVANVAAADIHLRGQDYSINVYADSRVDGAEDFAALIVGAENVQPYKRYCLKVNGTHPDANEDTLCDNCGASVYCEHENGEWREMEKATCNSYANYTWYCFDCQELVDTMTKEGDTLDADNHVSEDYTWQYADGTYSFTCTACSVKIEQTTAPTIYVSADGDDAYDGTTVDKAVASITDAVSRIANVGGTVVICGSYPISGELTLPEYTKPITISGLDENNAYIHGGFKITDLTVISLGGETKLDNISFDGDATYVIECNWNDTTFGKVEATGGACSNIVLGSYNITESNDTEAEATLTITDAATIAMNASGDLEHKYFFYAYIYLGDTFGADEIYSANKNVTLNVTDAEIGVLYTMSTSGTYANNPVGNCEATVNIYGDAMVYMGRTGDKNAVSAESTGSVKKQTLNFFDNASIGNNYYIRNAENTVINVSSEAEGRTRPLTLPFTFYAYGTFATNNTPINITLNCSTHSYATWVETPFEYQIAADALKVVTENVTDECVYDNVKVTVTATPDSEGTKLYSCSCGRSYTEQYTYSCAEATHIYLAKADGTFECTACGEAFDTVSGDISFALSPVTTNSNTVDVTLSLNASAIAAAQINVTAPEGFTFTGATIPEAEGVYVSVSEADPCTVYLLSATGMNTAVNTGITLTYSVAETVALGDYVFELTVSEVYDENSKAVVATPVSATVTVSEEEILLGDIDGDGIVTITDALTLLRAVVNDQTLVNGDLNGDGKVSLIDVIRVFKLIVK